MNKLFYCYLLPTGTTGLFIPSGTFATGEVSLLTPGVEVL